MFLSEEKNQKTSFTAPAEALWPVGGRWELHQEQKFFGSFFNNEPTLRAS
jgi:hypothetical protein